MKYHLFLGGVADGKHIWVHPAANHVDVPYHPSPILELHPSAAREKLGHRTECYLRTRLEAPADGDCVEVFVPIGRNAKWALARLLQGYAAQSFTTKVEPA